MNRKASEEGHNAEIRNVKENLGSGWSYDAIKEVFRDNTCPWFTFDPDTNQYYNEKEHVFYDKNHSTLEYEKAPRKKSKKLACVQSFKRSLKEFLVYVSKNGLPRSQFLKSIRRLRTRAEENYRKNNLWNPPSAKLEEVEKKLLQEAAGGYFGPKGAKVLVDPPYNCPLCGRSTSDLDTLLVHVKLHESCNERGLLPRDAKLDENSTTELLLNSEAPFVVGSLPVQQAVEMSSNRNGLNNKKRYQAYTYMKNWLGIYEHEDFSCDVIHAVRAAFPESHGCYSGRHNCASYVNREG